MRRSWRTKQANDKPRSAATLSDPPSGLKLFGFDENNTAQVFSYRSKIIFNGGSALPLVNGPGRFLGSYVINRVLTARFV